MAIQIQGNGGAIAEVDGTTFRSVRNATRPVDYTTGGSYRVAATTGTIAATFAANAQFFQFRWTSASLLAVIHHVTVKFKTLTVFTSATLTDFGFDMFIARSMSAGGGGTTLTMTGNNAKLRANMATSAVGNINISQTALLTAATTLDSHAIASSVGHPNRRTPATAIEEPLDQVPVLDYRPNVANGEHPLVLTGTAEGFVIRNRTVWPAAGTGIFTVECGWSEVAAY